MPTSPLTRLGLIFIILCVADLPAHAGGHWSVQRNLTSYHLEPPSSYGRTSWNQQNEGLGVVRYLDDEDRFISAGFYSNSSSQTTIYAFLGRALVRGGGAHWRWRLDALLGGVSGYTLEFTPIILPQLSISRERHKLNMVLIPGLADTVPWALGFSYEYRL